MSTETTTQPSVIQLPYLNGHTEVPAAISREPWKPAYTHQQLLCFRIKRQRDSRYSDELKATALRRVIKDGMTHAAVAEELGIPNVATIALWKRVWTKQMEAKMSKSRTARKKAFAKMAAPTPVPQALIVTKAEAPQEPVVDARKFSHAVREVEKLREELQALRENPRAEVEKLEKVIKGLTVERDVYRRIIEEAEISVPVSTVVAMMRGTLS